MDRGRTLRSKTAAAAKVTFYEAPFPPSTWRQAALLKFHIPNLQGRMCYAPSAGSGKNGLIANECVKYHYNGTSLRVDVRGIGVS